MAQNATHAPSSINEERSAVTLSPTQAEVEKRLRNTQVTGPARGQAVKEKTREKLEETKEKVRERRNERIRHFYQTLKRRLQAAVERLKKLGERISKRLDKFASRGFEVTALRQKLTNAQSKLSEVEKTIAGLDLEVEAILTSDDPKIAFEKLRKTLREVKEDLKAIHQTYVEIITEIKATLPKTTESPVPVGATITVAPTQGM